jgi:hypothetical protein
MVMNTVDLEIARNKVTILSAFLDGLAHIDPANGMSSYFAARAVRNGNLRVGVERRCASAKKALKNFNVMVSVVNNRRGIPTVRLYAPTKQIEILL